MKNIEHITYFDFLRGVAILMVIGIHTYVAGDFNTIDGSVRIIIRQLLNCAVPIFLALSAFFLSRKKLDTKNSIMIFWKKQIPKVYRPCFIWSIPWFVLSALGGFNKYQIVNLLICGYSIYYFIALIIQYYLLLPIFLKYTKFMLFCSGIVSAISIMLITYLSSVKGLQLPLILYAGPFTTWFIFYMLGVYISKYEKKYSIIVAMCIIIVGFILECLETYYLNTNYVGGVGIKLSSYIYSCGVILLVLSPKVQTLYKDNLFTATISYIGRISFGLYLIHCYVIQLLFVVFPTSSWRLSFCIVTFVTILIVMLSRKVLPQYLNKYLGFV